MPEDKAAIVKDSGEQWALIHLGKRKKSDTKVDRALI